MVSPAGSAGAILHAGEASWAAEQEQCGQAWAGGKTLSGWIKDDMSQRYPEKNNKYIGKVG